jgi:hypothetical protein
MKNTFSFLCILCVLMSCSDDPSEQPTLEAGYPHDWVFTTGGESNPPQDPSVAEYEYIYTNKTAMFRDDILKSYPLNDLVEEEHCLFYVSEGKCQSTKTCYTIQLSSDKIRFLGVGQSSNKEEMHLVIAKGSEVVVTGNPTMLVPPDGDDGDEFQFYIHRLDDVNGIITVAIESAGMPGWYISSAPPGFNYAQNVVTLQQSKNAEGATKWQCRGVN